MSGRRPSAARLRPSGSRPAEDGETLIELLISLVILGIMGAAIVGALMMAVDVSKMHERQVELQQYLRSWAERVSNATDAQSPCDDACVLGLAPPAVSGLSPSIGGSECWNPTASDWADGCHSGADLRRVTLTVAMSGAIMPGPSRSLSVVVRRPCAAGSSC